MKTKLQLFTTCWCLSLLLVCCEQEQKTNPMVPPPAPPSLVVSGCVCSANQQPLESVHIVLDSVIFDKTGNPVPDETYVWKAAYWTNEYSDKDGNFTIYYGHDYMDYGMEWPSKIVLTAQDTSGVYASQTDTFSVIMTKSFPDMPSYQNYMHGLVTAKFLLKSIL